MMRRQVGRLVRAITRPPYRDASGHKGWFERISRAQPHHLRRLEIAIAGWPATPRALRIAFLSDFHAGSHAGDAARLRAIVAEAAALAPDLVLYGGDFVNMQLIGGGRLPPHTIADILARLDAPLGRYAVLGNHDHTYGPEDVVEALEQRQIRVLADAKVGLDVAGHAIDLIGLPDARDLRPTGLALLRTLDAARPSIVLAHDPAWFAHVPSGPHLTLAGHTHGGQVCVPLVGALTNASSAPRRWTYGHVVEQGRHMYVTSGLGSSGIPLRINMPPEYALIEVRGH